MKDTLSNQRPKFATVYHFAIGKLTPIAMACYVVLCKYADNEKHDAFPGHAKIATVAKMSRSSVKRALAELVSEKLVSIRKMGRKGQEHNHYTLLFPASIQARTGGMVPTEPRVSQNRGRSPQSPELDSGYLDSETKNKKHGVVDTTSVSNSLSFKRKRSSTPSRAVEISTAGKSKADPRRSSRGAWSPDEWRRLLEHLRKLQFEDIDWRHIKRDRGALRSLFPLVVSVEDKVQAVCDALDESVNHLGDYAPAEQMFSVTTEILEREYGASRSRWVLDRENWKAAAEAAGMSLAEFAAAHPNGLEDVA